MFPVAPCSFKNYFKKNEAVLEQVLKNSKSKT